MSKTFEAKIGRITLRTVRIFGRLSLLILNAKGASDLMFFYATGHMETLFWIPITMPAILDPLYRAIWFVIACSFGFGTFRQIARIFSYSVQTVKNFVARYRIIRNV